MKMVTTGFLVMTAVIFIGTGIMVAHVGFDTADAASWIQAGGSIWAVLAAAWLTWWQAEEARRQAAEATRQAILEAAEAAEIAKRDAIEIAERDQRDTDLVFESIAHEVRGAVQQIIQEVNSTQFAKAVDMRKLDTQLDLLKALLLQRLTPEQRLYAIYMTTVIHDVLALGGTSDDQGVQFMKLKSSAQQLDENLQTLNRICNHYARPNDLDPELFAQMIRRH